MLVSCLRNPLFLRRWKPSQVHLHILCVCVCVPTALYAGSCCMSSSYISLFAATSFSMASMPPPRPQPTSRPRCARKDASTLYICIYTHALYIYHIWLRVSDSTLRKNSSSSSLQLLLLVLLLPFPLLVLLPPLLLLVLVLSWKVVVRQCTVSTPGTRGERGACWCWPGLRRCPAPGAACCLLALPMPLPAHTSATPK